MSQILLREINKYNNSIGYFSKNKKLSYSSTDIYIGTSDTKQPLIINWEECRSATAFYGCIEKIKIIYLNIIMQAIETNVPFSIINTIFTPEELEDKIKYKLSKTSYKYPVYNIQKEDLENSNLSILTREASMIVHFHNSSQHEKTLLSNTFDRSLLNHFNGKQDNNYRLRVPYTLMIMAFLEDNIIHNPNYISMGRGLGIYNFFSNNELDHSKLANSRVSILLEDKYNADYKETVDMFQLRQVNNFDPYVDNLKKHLKSTETWNRDYKRPLSTSNSYIIREGNDIIKLAEIKKFYE
jgi:hypothetical protein